MVLMVRLACLFRLSVMGLSIHAIHYNLYIGRLLLFSIACLHPHFDTGAANRHALSGSACNCMTLGRM